MKPVLINLYFCLSLAPPASDLSTHLHFHTGTGFYCSNRCAGSLSVAAELKERLKPSFNLSFSSYPPSSASGSATTPTWSLASPGPDLVSKSSSALECLRSLIWLVRRRCYLEVLLEIAGWIDCLIAFASPVGIASHAIAKHDIACRRSLSL